MVGLGAQDDDLRVSVRKDSPRKTELHFVKLYEAVRRVVGGLLRLRNEHGSILLNPGFP